ncbi:MAG TPA: carboxymuconolactone decarboxylase family protein [Casimicrobiaceae bacterium]|nr:carboxymuconolactone decarboxylase family protein [Casimicrobiaceae bacterium]
MSKNFPGITTDITRALRTLRNDIPEVTRAFSALAQAATTARALDGKTKELIALALGVAAHCDACVGFHVKALASAGATREELAEALGMAVYMGGGPSLMYAAEAITAWEQFSVPQADRALEPSATLRTAATANG